MLSFVFTVRQPVRIFLVILYALCIALLSLLPASDFPQVPLFRGFDKLVHFGMYFILTILFCWAIKTEIKYSRLITIWIVNVGWGLFMEIMQSVMHFGRSFSYFDMLANMLGVFSGLFIYVLLSFTSRKEI